MAGAPYVTKAEIEEYLDLNERRLSLQRQAEALAKQAEPMKERLLEYVRIKGGAGLSVLRSGFVLAIKIAKGAVAWKAEFIRVAGMEEAEELISAAEPRQTLSVERAA